MEGSDRTGALLETQVEVVCVQTQLVRKSFFVCLFVADCFETVLLGIDMLLSILTHLAGTISRESIIKLWYLSLKASYSYQTLHLFLFSAHDKQNV